MMLWVIGTTFGVSALIGIPIAFAIGLSGVLYIIVWEGLPPQAVIGAMYYPLTSFSYLAIPLFMLMGALADKCGLLDALMRWLILLVGRVKAGMAFVCVLSNTVMAGISGAAVADLASLGPIQMKLMRGCGYRDDFSACLNAASTVLAPIIPPSIGIVIYAIATGHISIAGLFLAGAVPGLVMAIGLLLLSWLILRGQDLAAVRERLTMRDFGRRLTRTTLEVIPILLLPFVIVGSIVSGAATVTESAAIGLVYVLLYGIFVARRLSWHDLFRAFVWTSLMTGVVGILISTSAVVGWILTRNRTTAIIADYLIEISSDPLVFMVATVAVLFLLALPLEPVVLIIALAPLLAPVAETYGIHPFQFAIVFIIVAEVGLITPPIGTLLFMISSIAKVPLERIFLAIWPFVLLEMAVAVIAMLWPPLTLWLPQAFGFT